MALPSLRPNAIAVYVYRPALEAARTGRYDFLQIRRSAKARGHRHSWQTVYGGVEAEGGRNGREISLEAALRELREETGLRPKRMFQVEYVEIFYFRASDEAFVMPVFGVEAEPGAVIVLNHEHDDSRWTREEDIGRAFMWRTQREALAELLRQLREPGEAQRFLEIAPAEWGGDGAERGRG